MYGVIFSNTKENLPAYTGIIDVTETEKVKIEGSKKNGKDGKAFISLKVPGSANISDGALFTNESTNDAAPVMTGTLKIKGANHKVACWAKTAKSGVKYLSVKLELIQDTTEEKAPEQSDGENGDLPF
jgi:hypothetical protein